MKNTPTPRDAKLYKGRKQTVYENSRFSSNAGLRDKVSRTCGHTHKKADGFLYRNRNVREAILGLSRLDYPSAKAGGTVNGGAIFAPFILTVDWLGWLCYVIASKHFGDILPRISCTKYILLRFSYFGNCMELLHSLDISFHTFRTKYISSCRLWCEKAKNNSSVSKKL